MISSIELLCTFTSLVIIITLNGSLNSTHLYSGLGEVDFHGQLFTHEYVWIACLFKSFLKLFQLVACEICPMASLLSFPVRLRASNGHRRGYHWSSRRMMEVHPCMTVRSMYSCKRSRICGGGKKKKTQIKQ